MDITLGIARFVHYVAIVLLFGTALFPVYALPSNVDRHADQALQGWLRPLQQGAAAAAILSLLAWFAAQAMTIAGSLDAESLWAVAQETSFGHVWLGRFGLALAALCLLVTRAGRSSVTILAALLVASLAGVGHASTSAGWQWLPRMVVDALHLLAGAVWLGGLLPLGYVLRQARAPSPSIWPQIARQALPRFSHMGYGAVCMLVLTGCVNAAFLVPSPDALIETPYGRLLSLKIGLFILMLALAALNRLKLAPRVAAEPPAPRSVDELHRNAALELGLGAAILAVVSALGIMAPPLAAG
jgi:copper resistance protein D